MLAARIGGVSLPSGKRVQVLRYRFHSITWVREIFANGRVHHKLLFVLFGWIYFCLRLIVEVIGLVLYVVYLGLVHVVIRITTWIGRRLF